MRWSELPTTQPLSQSARTDEPGAAASSPLRRGSDAAAAWPVIPRAGYHRAARRAHQAVTPRRSQQPSHVVIVAAAGYGKSAALETDRPRGGRLWRAAELAVGELPATGWIGIDDVDALEPGDQDALFERLSTRPAPAGFTLTCRTPLDPALLRRLRGPVFERGPADLALGAHAIAGLLAEEYGVLDPEAAGRVFSLTSGWPALVHFAADALAHRADVDLADALSAPGSAAASWIASNVLAALPQPVQDLLGLAAGLGPVTPQLCDQLARFGALYGTEAALEQLRRLGVLVPRRRPGGGDLLGIVPAISAALVAARCGTPPEVGLLATAARCYQ